MQSLEGLKAKVVQAFPDGSTGALPSPTFSAESIQSARIDAKKMNA